jgi:hypothetical protein
MGLPSSSNISMENTMTKAEQFLQTEAGTEEHNQFINEANIVQNDDGKELYFVWEADGSSWDVETGETYSTLKELIAVEQKKLRKEAGELEAVQRLEKILLAQLN